MDNNMFLRTNSGITLVSTEMRLFEDRKIYLSGEINVRMMNEFSQKLQILKSVDDSPITIFLDSNGGEVRAGLAIYNMIVSMSGEIEINICVLSKAFSMAAVILAAGKPGHRWIMPYSEVMIHEPVITSYGDGSQSTSTMKSLSDNLISTKKTIDGILAKHTGKSVEEVAKATSFDNYMKGEQILDFGIADKIVDFADVI